MARLRGFFQAAVFGTGERSEDLALIFSMAETLLLSDSFEDGLAALGGAAFGPEAHRDLSVRLFAKTAEEAARLRAAAPFHTFMLSHVREKDLRLFVEMQDSKIETPEATPYQVLIPAFMISELRRAFEIGFLIFIPFLIIDMVIASILMAMGMMMLPPVVISLPFKIIFFVLIDGWYMIAGSLVRSFGA